MNHLIPSCFSNLFICQATTSFFSLKRWKLLREFIFPDGAWEARSHFVPGVWRKRIYKFQWDNANILGIQKQWRILCSENSLRGNVVINSFLNKKGFSYCTPDCEVLTCTNSSSPFPTDCGMDPIHRPPVNGSPPHAPVCIATHQLTSYKNLQFPWIMLTSLSRPRSYSG